MKTRVLTIGVMGAPNVGKSTFINQLIGKKVSIVSPKPHTTRMGVMGVLTENNIQLIFVDTPGISHSKQKDQKIMNKNAKKYFDQVDLMLVMFDSTKKIPPQVEFYSNLLNNKIAIFNKMDLIKKSRVLPLVESMLTQFEKFFFISALHKDGMEEVKQYLFTAAKPQHFLYDVKTTCTIPQHRFIKDLAQEVIFHLFDNEIPYKIKIENTSLYEENNILYITQIIYVTKSQKPIFLSKIKELSSSIRKNISNHFRIKVNNQLLIKVQK